MAAAFGRVVDIQKQELDEHTKAALSFSNLGRDKVVQFFFFLICKYDNFIHGHAV